MGNTEETKKECCKDCNCSPDCCSDNDSGCCSDGKCCCCCECSDDCCK